MADNAPNERAIRVFVLEDDPDLAEMLRRWFAGAGMEFSHCADGEAAWELLQGAPPDVVLADLMVPGISGQEFVAKLRAHPATSHTAVIVMSASILNAAQGAEMKDILQADHVFSKPLLLRDVLAKVRELTAR
ncbi:MAG: response regulator transcription factor [Deltaproteobacteria bacterium]|nr:response regulator transcription factor [Deltaproteobacteria bacterium]